MITPKQLPDHLRAKRTELYGLYDNDEYFAIDTHDNPYLEHEYEGELRAMRAAGQDYHAAQAVRHKDRLIEEMAKKFANHQHAEYQHIVDTLSGINQSEEFKCLLCLLLNETLAKVYYKDKDGNRLVQPRVKNKSIAGHLVLEETTVQHIMENVCRHQSFSSLYFSALEELNRQTLEKSKVTLDGVNTFDKGHWVKFDSRETDKDNFEQNAKKLASLVQETPWCTKTLASAQLSHGDFYVFVDKEKKPHLAVKMSGQRIGEVRGVASLGERGIGRAAIGAGQEIEPEYMDVTESFLSNNKGVVGGKQWLEDVQFRRNLVWLNGSIANGTFEQCDVPLFLKVLEIGKRKHLYGITQYENFDQLEKNISKIRHFLATHFGYPDVGDGFHYGNFTAKSDSREKGIKVVYGNVCLNNSASHRLNNPIEVVTGNFDIKSSKIRFLDTLVHIGGDLRLNDYVVNLPELKYLGGKLVDYGSKARHIRKLTIMNPRKSNLILTETINKAKANARQST